MPIFEGSESLPYIGWKACEERFYLDGMPISASEAYKHLKEGTAIFGSNARKQIGKLFDEQSLADLWERN